MTKLTGDKLDARQLRFLFIPGYDGRPGWRSAHEHEGSGYSALLRLDQLVHLAQVAVLGV